MTSVDSGVETSNDSSDSYVAQESQSPHEISPIKSTAIDSPAIIPQSTMDCPSSSEVENDVDSCNEKTEPNKNADIIPPLRPLPVIIDPPAGLSFCNLQPSPLSLGTGYEVLGNGQRFALAVYQSVDLQSKLRTVRCCLKNRKDPWQQFKQPLDERKLRHAAVTNNVERVTLLLSSGVNPNCCDDLKRSPLHLAACKGYTEIVRLLLEKGANPNQKDSLGNTPLHLAACTNHVGVVTLLLKAGTDVGSNDYFGRNPLQLAQSKLKLLQRGHADDDSKRIKSEVQQVIEMMKAFLQKKGHDMEAELLSAFSSRLTLSQTKEEVETDVRDLLASLSNLSLNKNESAK